MNTKARVPDRGRVIAGVAILAAGVALLIFQLTGRDLGFGTLWPLIVVGVGLTGFVDAEDGRRRGSGMVTMLVGCWLLINTLGLFDLTYQDSWPLLLIFLGLARLFASDGRGFGALMILVGAWFLARNFGLWDADLNKVWPILIIVVGISIVWKALTTGRLPRHEEVNDDGTR